MKLTFKFKMRMFFALGISIASLFWPLSAQQHVQQAGDRQQTQCSVPHEDGNRDVPQSSLLQVHQNASSDRNTLPLNRSTVDGLTSGKTSEPQTLTEQQSYRNGLAFGDEKTRPLAKRPLNLSSKIANTTEMSYRTLISDNETHDGVNNEKSTGVQTTPAIVLPAASHKPIIMFFPAENSTATTINLGLAMTSMGKSARAGLWVVTMAVIIIVAILALSGYFLVADDEDTKTWKRRHEELHSAPLSRGIDITRPPDLDEGRRARALHRLADHLEHQSYPSQFSAAPTAMPSARESRKNLPSAWTHSVPQSSVLLQRPSSGGRSSFESAAIHDETLSPGLVVPPGTECILAIRAVVTPFTTTTSTIIDILDLKGNVVLKAYISSRQPKQMSSSRPTSDKALITIRVAGLTEPGEVLASCHQGNEDIYGRPSMDIYNVRDEAFGTVTQDSKTVGRWVFVGIPGAPKLFFDRSSFDRSMIVTDSRNEQVADTEPCTFDFDGHHYKLRVSPDTDVGLVLCGLLSIEWLEKSVRQS